MDNTTRPAPQAWHVFVHGRQNQDGQPFATVTDAVDAQDAIDQVKSDLNGSPANYDRDALAPALVAVPAGCATTAAPASRTARTG